MSMLRDDSNDSFHEHEVDRSESAFGTFAGTTPVVDLFADEGVWSQHEGSYEYPAFGSDRSPNVGFPVDGDVQTRDVIHKSTPTGLPVHDNSRHHLPFSLDAEAIEASRIAFLDTFEPSPESDFGTVKPSDTIFSPLAIDTTRTLWQRLTVVDPKRPKYRGSNLQKEVTAILRGWHVKTRNQPSWNRPVSIQKKNRESIGPALFGWGRTDLPAWTGPANTPKFAVPIEREDENHDKIEVASDVESNDFGDFESAPLPGSGDPKPSGQVLLLESVGTVARDPYGRDFDQTKRDLLDSQLTKQSPSAAKSASNLPTVVTHRGHADLFELESLEQSVPTTVLTDQSIAPSLPAHASHDPWDLSIFETPSSTPANHSTTGVLPTEDPARRPRSNTRTKQELENQETIARVVSFLPDIEYLLT